MEIQRISSLTSREMVTLRVTLETIGSKEYDCQKCLSSFRGMADEANCVKANCARKFCTSPSPSFVHRLTDHLGQINFKLCPGNYRNPGLLHLLAINDSFERGIPPFSGGYFDQPPKLLEALEVVSGWRAARRAKSQRDSTARQKGSLIGR